MCIGIPYNFYKLGNTYWTLKQLRMTRVIASIFIFVIRFKTGVCTDGTLFNRIAYNMIHINY